MKTIEFRKSNVFLLVNLLGSLGFVAAGIFLLATGKNLLASWMSIIFFGACALVIGHQLFSTGPRLVIDQRGVYDQTLGVGVIPWDRIESASVWRVHSTSFIGLEVLQIEDFLRRLSPIKRKLVDLNQKLGYPSLSINLTGLDADPDAICELILKQVEARRRGIA